jgi:hypothetical protein
MRGIFGTVKTNREEQAIEKINAELVQLQTLHIVNASNLARSKLCTLVPLKTLGELADGSIACGEDVREAACWIRDHTSSNGAGAKRLFELGRGYAIAHASVHLNMSGVDFPLALALLASRCGVFAHVLEVTCNVPILVNLLCTSPLHVHSVPCILTRAEHNL